MQKYVHTISEYSQQILTHLNCCIHHLEYKILILSFYNHALGINCGQPDEPKNGTVLLSNIGEGVIATYSCKPCFVLEGENTRVCNRSENWTGSVPECRSTYCN